MQLYNTMTRRKENFEPIRPGKVGMYACGITAYDLSHIGHARSAVVFDVLTRYLRHVGYDVTFVRNFTDVDDKIINRANKEGKTSTEIAETYITAFHEDMDRLNVRRADIEPRATEYITQMQERVERLIEKGHAYAVPSGDVYFRVRSFKDYGKLSGRDVDDLRSGARIAIGEEKEDPLDFALWKAAKPGEPFWESPWGNGRPGWHLECSAMSEKNLELPLDIHGGGQDLIFPHHENEIAQTEALTGKPFVKYWTHNGLIKVNGQKMSKSLGNSLLLADLLEKYSDEAVKFALLQTNYRNDINVTDGLFPEAEKHLYEFYSLLFWVDKIMDKLRGNELTVSQEEAISASQVAMKVDSEFNACMDDDFNTALALSNLFGYFKDIKKNLSEGKTGGLMLALSAAVQIRKTYSILGLFTKNAKEYKAWYESKNAVSIPTDVQAVAEERWAARLNRDWAKSDELRAKLAEMGYSVKDSKTGYDLTKN